jgi:hypothetical protein
VADAVDFFSLSSPQISVNQQIFLNMLGLIHLNAASVEVCGGGRRKEEGGGVRCIVSLIFIMRVGISDILTEKTSYETKSVFIFFLISI